jgi:3-hydroxyacyl-CoA dehydrogenase
MNLSDIKRIAVVGAGLMGHEIAQEFALAGSKLLKISKKTLPCSEKLDW